MLVDMIVRIIGLRISVVILGHLEVNVGSVSRKQPIRLIKVLANCDPNRCYWIALFFSHVDTPQGEPVLSFLKNDSYAQVNFS